MLKGFRVVLSVIIVMALLFGSGFPFGGRPVAADELGGSISGTVYESDGTTPIEGAVVSVWKSVDTLLSGFPADGEATTDADGNYSITGLPAGNYSVAAVADGYERLWYQDKECIGEGDLVTVTEGLDTDNINFSLGPGGTISGTVTDQDTGLPLSDIRLLATNSNMSRAFSVAFTDASGNYTLEGLRYDNYAVFSTYGSYIIECWEEKTLADEPDLVTVAEGINPTGIDFTLEEGSIISGHIYATDSGDPIEKAMIVAWDYDSSPGSWISRGWGFGWTDEEGYYETTGLSAGDYAVAAVADGYERLFYPDIHLPQDPEVVTVTEGQDTDNINFSLDPGGTISGTVSAQDGGSPLPDVSVSAGYYSMHGVAWAAITDENGEYTLDGLPYDSYRVMSPSTVYPGSGDDSYILELWEEKSFGETADTVTIAEGSNPTGIDFTLEVGGIISGYVDDGSDPIAGAIVFAYDYDSLLGSWIIRGIGSTDEEGYYETIAVPAGDYGVRVQADGYASEWYNGTYYREDATKITVAVSSNTTINFTLEQGGSISGHVQDSVGDPIPNLHLYATDNVTNQWIAGVNADTSGNYTLSGLPEGSYLVRACASCSGLSYIDEYYDNTYFYDEAEAVTVTPLDDTPGIDFSLELGKTISGHVYATDGGDPIAGAHVEVIDYTSLSGQWLHYGGDNTDENGYYRTSGLPEGSYAVRVRADGYANEWYDGTYYKDDADAVPIGVSEDVEDIDFYLEAGGSISGHVQDNVGDPIPNLHLYATDNATNQWMAGVNTDASGNYTLSGLPAGNYRVRACASCSGLPYIDEWYDNSHYEEPATSVAVSAHTDTSGIDFSLEPGGSISGTITDASTGLPLPEVSVMAFPYTFDTWVLVALTDENGDYTIPGLPYGAYYVKAPVSQGSGDDNYATEFWQDVLGYPSATIINVAEGVNPTGIDFDLEVSGNIFGTVLDQDTGLPLTDASSGSINLDIGWHKFVYRQEAYEGPQASRAAFKAPGDTEWRWFSTSELEIRTAPDHGADSGILLINKKNTWNYPQNDYPQNHTELVTCVDIDSIVDADWYGESIVDTVDQNENIHGFDDYFTSYYEGYFYVDTAGAWSFSTDSAEASEIVIDDQVVAYWYGRHSTDDRWDCKMAIQLFLYDTWEAARGTRGNTDGSYTFERIRPGTYIVRAFSPGYADEWYQEVTIPDDASGVDVFSNTDTMGIDFTLKKVGSISGHVQDSVGDPIPNLHVYATDNVTGQWTAGTNTDASGNYVLPGLSEGSYLVRACATCSDLLYFDEWYDNAGSEENADPVSVTPPANTLGINFILTESGGSISGHVYATDGGNPIEGATVVAFAYDSLSGSLVFRSSDMTDEDGYYKTSGLPDGDYGVLVRVTGYASEWWEDAYYLDDADAIPVGVSEDIENIDFYLEPGGSISGHVQDSVGDPIADLRLNATGNETNQWIAMAITDASGNYTIGGLPEGGYHVETCASCDDLPYVDEWYDDIHTSWQDADSVTVTPPADTPGINFTLGISEVPLLTVTTNAADGITTDSAVLHGYLDSLGDYSSANVSFEWGTNSGALDQETDAEVMNSTGAFSADLTGLDPDTPYYYRAKAVADSETVYGDELSFNTLETDLVEVIVSAPETVPEDVDFTATVDIGEVTDLNAVQYEISFDTSVLRLDDITSGQIDSTEIDVMYNEIDTGVYQIVQSLGLGSVSGSGYLAVLHFHVIGSLGDNSSIDISNGLIVDIDENEVPASWTGDFVEISVIPGDANGDGIVNVADMTRIARIILQLTEETPGADANQDGVINVADMTRVARIILQLYAPAEYGGILTVAVGSTLSSPNPIQSGPTILTLNSYTHDKLGIADWTRGPAGTGELNFSSSTYYYPYISALAESWEQYDPYTFILHLRPGVHFHDKPPVNGRELVADDVVFSITHLLSHPEVSTHINPAYLESIMALDKYTVEIKSNTLDIRFLEAYMTGPGISIRPPEMVETYGEEFTNLEGHCGTGPFVLTDFTSNSSATLVRNPDYWGYDELNPDNQLPYVDGVKFLMITDNSTRLAALRAGNLDLLPSVEINHALSLMGTNPELEYSPYLSNMLKKLSMRQDKEELPFSDIRVRKALSMAIDREAIIGDYLHGMGETMTYPLNPVDSPDVYIPLEELPEATREQFEYNPEKAKQLLADAAYPDGFQTKCITTEQTVEQLQILAAYWKAIGIDCEIQVVDQTAWLNLTWGKKYEQMTYGVTGTTNPIYTLAERTSDAFFNYDMHFDPEFDALFAELIVTADESAQNQMIQELTISWLDGVNCIQFPGEYQYNFWWPWVKNYHGETALGWQNQGGLNARIWVDQELKEAMGY